jgi:hypothetical protein
VDESTFLDACMTGRPVDLREGGTRGEIDADLVRRVCRRYRQEVDPRRIQVDNASVVGSVDFRGMEVPFPVRFDGCHFTAPLLLEGASLHELAVTNCHAVPGILANGVCIRRDIDLSGSLITARHYTRANTTASETALRTMLTA